MEENGKQEAHPSHFFFFCSIYLYLFKVREEEVEEQKRWVGRWQELLDGPALACHLKIGPGLSHASLWLLFNFFTKQMFCSVPNQSSALHMVWRWHFCLLTPLFKKGTLSLRLQLMEKHRLCMQKVLGSPCYPEVGGTSGQTQDNTVLYSIKCIMSYPQPISTLVHFWEVDQNKIKTSVGLWQRLDLNQSLPGLDLSLHSICLSKLFLLLLTYAMHLLLHTHASPSCDSICFFRINIQLLHFIYLSSRGIWIDHLPVKHRTFKYYFGVKYPVHWLTKLAGVVLEVSQVRHWRMSPKLNLVKFTPETLVMVTIVVPNAPSSRVASNVELMSQLRMSIAQHAHGTKQIAILA